MGAGRQASYSGGINKRNRTERTKTMAHELSIKNGQAEMVSGRGITPWHGLGKVVNGLMTAGESLSLAGLDWKVAPSPVSVMGKQLPFPTEENSKDCWQGICRTDTNDCLGIVKGKYECIQNVEAFDFFDSLIGQGKAVYDTAGALRGGKQVWLLAKVNGEIKINGDEHREHALLLTSHDGSHAMQVMWVMTRVVCANTLSIALQGASNTCKIRHTKSWKDKEGEARRVLGLGQNYYSTIQEALAGMSDKLMTAQQMQDFSKLLLPSRDENELSTRLKNIRDEVSALFGSGAGNKGRSRWDALNAVTDYVDHDRTLNGESSTRLEASLFGSGAKIKQRAFDLLTNESIMGALLEGTFTPSSRTVDADFSRLLGN